MIGWPSMKSKYGIWSLVLSMSQTEKENENSNTLDKNQRKKVKEAFEKSNSRTSNMWLRRIIRIIPFLVTTTVHAIKWF